MRLDGRRLLYRMLIVLDFVCSLRACFLATVVKRVSVITHSADVIFVQTAGNQRTENYAECFV